MNDEITRGPWQVLESKLPFNLHLSGKVGSHIVREIATEWKHGQLDDFYPVVICSTGISTEACLVHRFVHISEPDAHLIAAAPELLEALEECLREHRGFTINGKCERMVRAAIDKARGLNK